MDLASCRLPVAAGLLVFAVALLLTSDGTAAGNGRFIQHISDLGSDDGVAISDDGRFVAVGLSVFDRLTGASESVGVPSSFLRQVAMSGDGRFVAFVSRTPLLPEDDNVLCGTSANINCRDVYVYDRELATHELVSVADDGSVGNDASGFWSDIALSYDGRYVAFSSWASNLAPGDTKTCYREHSCGDVFVRDRLLETTVRVSVASDGTEADQHSGAVGVSMSGGGRFVAFDSYAENLAPGGNESGSAIFLRDRDTDEDGVYDEPEAVETVKVGDGTWPAVSDDGQFVAFFGQNEILLHDGQADSTTVVSPFFLVTAALDLSGDGRYLAFSTSEPLAPEDTNNKFESTDVYLYDRVTDSVELVSKAKNGTPGNAGSGVGFKLESLSVIALTPDAQFVAFVSGATNLVPGHTGAFVAGPPVPAGLDTDGDGCRDRQELGPDKRLGGRRSPENFWDFFDVPAGDALQRDGVVSGADIATIVARFGATDSGPGSFDRNSDPLSTPNAVTGNNRENYHPAYDRGGPIPGADLWDLLPADGAISGGDLAAVVIQFGDSCSAS